VDKDALFTASKQRLNDELIMNRLSKLLLVCIFFFPLCLMAGTVVITSLPDEEHPLEPITSVNGVPLTKGTSIRVGALPGMTDDEVLDAASSGGIAEIVASFVPFGSSKNIGDGVDGAVGRFEIALRQAITQSSPLVGEEISLIIQKEGGQEFFVARFKEKLFAADPETGLERLLSLHIADAKAITGSRYGQESLATAETPVSGSFETWIDSFSDITDPLLKLPDTDADGDGRSNYLEYVTGHSPVTATEPQPCQIYRENNEFWIRFSRARGLGSAQPMVEVSHDLISPWQKLEGPIEPDPSPPTTGSLEWMRIRVDSESATTPKPQEFFRLRTGP
jgi:hypothetical protein